VASELLGTFSSDPSGERLQGQRVPLRGPGDARVAQLHPQLHEPPRVPHRGLGPRDRRGRLRGRRPRRAQRRRPPAGRPVLAQQPIGPLGAAARPDPSRLRGAASLSGEPAAQPGDVPVTPGRGSGDVKTTKLEYLIRIL